MSGSHEVLKIWQLLIIMYTHIILLVGAVGDINSAQNLYI